MNRKDALPKKDIIASNQRSWPETAKRMSAKMVLRCLCLFNKHRLMEHSIGAVKGKHKHLHNDPYARGECLSKHVKRDALS